MKLTRVVPAVAAMAMLAAGITLERLRRMTR